MFQKLKKTAHLVTLVLVTVFTLTACGNAAQNESGEEQSQTEATESTSQTEEKEEDLKVVKIGATSATAQLTENALLAQNLGYIDEELAKVGYKAEYVGFAQAGPAINEAFAAGEIDYAFYADFAAITAKSNNVDIKIIGAANTEMNLALIATEKSGIKSVKDIEGKKIIVSPGTTLYRYFIDICEKNDVDPNSVEQVNALADAQSLLASGDADGLITAYSAALMYGGLGLGNTVIDSTTDLEEATGFVLAGRTAFVRENAEVNKALLRALKRSAAYAKENTEDAYNLMETESTSVDILKATYAYNTSFDYFNPGFSEDYLKRAESVYNFGKENQVLGGEVDLKELFDSTYVDEVLAEEE